MDIPPPPPGFELDSAPPPPSPQGFVFDAPQDLPPPPDGFNLPTNPLFPAKTTQADEKPNTAVPGFWGTVGSAFGRGAIQRGIDDIAGTKVALPAGIGGKTLEEQYQEGLLHPETKDEIDNLLGKKVNEGWSDPKWWGAQVAHGAGGMLPAVGGAAVGSVARVPLPISFGVEGGLGTLVPAYKKARAEGLEPEAATTRALIDSGIAASTAAAMGLAPSIPLFGKTATVINEQVAQQLKRPVMEMLAQLGIVQPSLAVTGEIVKDLSHGEAPDPWGLATTYVVGAAQGVPIVGAHGAMPAVRALRSQSFARNAEAQPVASPEQVQRSFENQQPVTAPAEVPPRPEAPPPPEGFVLNERDVLPQEDRVFVSRLRQVATNDLPESASAQQVVATLRNKGVREEEMVDAGLPAYLADVGGRVNKADLIAHIEANAVGLEEKILAEAPMIKLARTLGEADNGVGSWSRIGGGGQEHYIAQARKIIMREHVKVLHELEAIYGYDTTHWPQSAKDRVQLVKAEVAAKIDPPESPNYPSQVLPGEHSNYREVLMRVPPRGEKILQEVDPDAPRGWGQVGDGQLEAQYNRRENFLQSHFPGAVNLIAHMRMTDRTGRNGERLLHIEEIQSDLHQAGRKKGYVDPNVRPFAEMQAERQRLNQEFAQMISKYPDLMEAGTDKIRQLREEGRIPADLENYMTRRGAHGKEYTAAFDNEKRVADLPFKTSWEELAVKRILRMAADEGYDGVSWSNGDQVGLRLNTVDQLKGNRDFYDRKISSLFGKWAKKMGMDVGETKFHESGYDAPTFNPMHLSRLRGMGLEPSKMNDRNKVVLLNPAAGSRIRQGLPLYETGPEGGLALNQAIQRGNPKEMKQWIAPLEKLLGQLGKDIKVGRNIVFEIGPKRATWRGQADPKNGVYTIRINTRLLSRLEDMYVTAMHEFGHVVMWDKFGKAPDHLQIQIRQVFDRFRRQMTDEARTIGDLRRMRDNPVSEMTGGRNLKMPDGRFSDTIPLSELGGSSRSYLMHFEEWFAEQVAKWGSTSEKPLSRVDKFFKDLGDIVRKLVTKFRGERPTSRAEAVPEMQAWLDSLLGDKGKFAADMLDGLDLNTKRKNADALDRDGTPEVQAVPATPSTVGGRNILDALPPDVRGSGNATAAHADRFNRFYEWMTSLPQIAELNKHIRPLQIYKEIVATMNLEKNTIMTGADTTLRQWRAQRDPKQQFSIGKFIEDYMNGHFKLVDDGIIRRPTQDEFRALATKHKMSDQSLKIFDKLVKDFDGLLESYRELLLADAYRIKDPQARSDAIDQITKRVDALLQRPYFPAMRFGKYTITVYDTAGNVRHFEQAETLRKQAQIKGALEKSPDLLPGDRVRTGEVAKDATPLLGMPPGLIDLMAQKLSLSDSQRNMLDQLRFDYAPSQSFRHQFRQKDLTPGYSTDFQRAYANFFFHGANHLTRVKWVDALRDQIREVKAGSVDLNDAQKRDGIGNYMGEHLNMLVDPKPDFAALRAMMFHWYLGFNPASATLNLSQTPLMTFPHLASKFGGLGVGDARAAQALLKASSDLNNFYKKGNLVERAKTAPPGPEGAAMRALGEAVKEGVISETQAHELAAVSEGRNLLRAFGTKTEEGWAKFSEASSYLFEMTEQYNRRVAFRAAWELGMRDPNNKYVQEVIRDNPILYDRLTNKLTGLGWSHQEAAAFAAAKDSVEKSQFVYAPHARPKFMWGRKGALFIFKSFVQNTLFNLWANPAMAARHLLILGGLGGLMGLPGAEDINGTLKALAYHLFGKDFDLEDQVRKFAVDVLNGNISPDMLLHGGSVKGFGIPHVMNALGAQVGLPKVFPTTDRHSSIGMGNILPFEPGKAFGPTKDVKASEIAQLQRASGAGFSNIFALYEFLNSQDSRADLKKWEKIMPRAMGNVSHAFRFLRDGAETNRAGNAVVRFDPNDTEHMAEILARAMGYQPRRLTGAWEAIAAKQEQATFWDLRKQILLRQFGTAVKGGNEAERDSVLQAIKNYNQDLPTEARAKAISAQTLKDSVYQRIRVQKMQEAGLPTSKQNYELFKSLDKYFPDGRPTGQIDARPVR